MEDDSDSLHGAKPMRDLPRKRFFVELKPNEVNVVSWKELTREPQQVTGSEEKPQPENTSRNYFSVVLERMEKIYKGVDSSDEEGKEDAEEVGAGPMDYYDSDDLQRNGCPLHRFVALRVKIDAND